MNDASIDLRTVRSFIPIWLNPLTLNRSSLHVTDLSYELQLLSTKRELNTPSHLEN